MREGEEAGSRRRNPTAVKRPGCGAAYSVRPTAQLPILAVSPRAIRHVYKIRLIISGSPVTVRLNEVKLAQSAAHGT